MNTLCEPAALEEPGRRNGQRGAVWDFKYPLIAPRGFPSARQAVHRRSDEIRMQRAESAAVEAARPERVAQGQRKARGAMARKVGAGTAGAYARLLEQFAQERRGYFRRVETDVVTLALAIARKLLHREAQIDPLLLSGIVRVALDQIQAGSQVVFALAAEQGELAELLSRLPESTRKHRAVADEAVEPGRVVLETVAGKAEMSLEEQLKEIESGFLDLLRSDERPFHERAPCRVSPIRRCQSRVRWQGRCHQVIGGLLESEGPPCCLGECCEARDSAGQVYSGEVVGSVAIRFW